MSCVLYIRTSGSAFVRLVVVQYYLMCYTHKVEYIGGSKCSYHFREMVVRRTSVTWWIYTPFPRLTLSIHFRIHRCFGAVITTEFMNVCSYICNTIPSDELENQITPLMKFLFITVRIHLLVYLDACAFVRCVFCVCIVSIYSRIYSERSIASSNSQQHQRLCTTRGDGGRV